MWDWLMKIHLGTLLVGALGGATILNTFAGELAKVAGKAFVTWAKKQRGRWLFPYQKKLLWLTKIGGGKLVIDTSNPGTPVIFSPQRGYPFKVRHKILPLVNLGLLEVERNSAPHIVYRLTEWGAERAEKTPDFESEFPVTGKFPDMEIY